MTSEVAVANKSCIAVAADSAVTVGKNKVHGSVNKLFHISVKEPIGMMVYGNAEFAGVPWETIVKLYRQENGEKILPTVKDYFDDFNSFVSSKKFINEEVVQESIVRFVISIIEKFEEFMDQFNKRDITRNLSDFMDAMIEGFQKTAESRDYCPMDLAAVSRKHGNDFVVIFNEVFDKYQYKIPKSLKSKLSEMVYLAILSKYTSDYMSGVVIFGFGQDQLFPQVLNYEFDGIPFGKPRILPRIDRSITSSNISMIVPFADMELMHTFMEGITPNLLLFLRKFTRRTLEETCNTLIKNNFSVTDDEMKTIKKMNQNSVDEVMEKYTSAVNDYISDKYVGPILNVVSSLPKGDMATLAEALVEITALKKKVSLEVESVGGPVDVCIVTKGDGFVWIKRKKYFDVDKNAQFLYRKFAGFPGL